MLSYILRIIFDYQMKHGYRPNTLLLNRIHLERLRLEFSDTNVEHMLDQLDVNFLLDEDSGHPKVCWFDRPQPQLAGSAG